MKKSPSKMIIESIRIHAVTAQRVLVLKEEEGTRSLFIWIGPNEADAIFIGLKHINVPRPLTHDLFLEALGKLGAKLISVTITDIAADTFFSRMKLQVARKTVELDARPSDAVALAVRAHAPIFAQEAVLKKAGVKDQEESLGEGKQKLGPFSNILEALKINEVEDDDDEREHEA